MVRLVKSQSTSKKKRLQIKQLKSNGVVKQIVQIDTIQSAALIGNFCSDFIELEWFEVHKRTLTRATNNGQTLRVELPEKQEWKHGDGLYFQGILLATIHIKPCLTIAFQSMGLVDAADFCYYIGNRHLPIYATQQNGLFLVPYDGQLYEQLQARYSNRISLREEQLFAEHVVRKKTAS